MPRNTHNTFATIRSEGALLPPDVLARIAAGDSDLAGLKPEDYDLARSDRFLDAVSRAWTRCRAYWTAFTAARQRLGAGETGVSETRGQWVIPLLQELGYDSLPYHAAAEEVGGSRYLISHRAGEGGPPVHIVGFRQLVDRMEAVATDGTPRRSPHGLVQEYLNRTDHVWGVVTNGLALRILRDNLSLTRAAFVEFDLEAMMDGGVYADFVLLYRLLHRSRFPRGTEDAAKCPLEKWRDAAIQQGTRARGELRAGVEAAIKTLGQALLAHQENNALRERLTSGDLPVEEFYKQLLRLIYRILFLLVAEERDLLFPEKAGDRADQVRKRAIYEKCYSVSRLRDIAARRHRYENQDDLWLSLAVTFRIMREGADSLGLTALNGGLFGEPACEALAGAKVSNEALLTAMRGLSVMRNGGITRRINYRDMDVEELGSVYESLLDFHPALDPSKNPPRFDLLAGSERKTTGSYYTRPELVNELIKSALEPVIAQRTESRSPKSEKRAALLSMKVCDPACGSGAFLLAAARRIGREVAILDTGETEPDPAALRSGTREAVRHCASTAWTSTPSPWTCAASRSGSRGIRPASRSRSWTTASSAETASSASPCPPLWKRPRKRRGSGWRRFRRRSSAGRTPRSR